MPKGKGRDRIGSTVGGTFISVKLDSVAFIVIVRVYKCFPRFVQPEQPVFPRLEKRSTAPWVSNANLMPSKKMCTML